MEISGRDPRNARVPVRLIDGLNAIRLRRIEAREVLGIAWVEKKVHSFRRAGNTKFTAWPKRSTP